MPAIDFSEVKGLEPVEAGVYEAEIVGAEVGVSNQGAPKIDIRWKIVEGANEGRQIFDTMSFHPNALWRTKLTLQALGFDNNYAGEVEPEDLIGLTAAITVTLQQNSDQIDPNTNEPYPPRNRVSRVKPAGNASVSSLLNN